MAETEQKQSKIGKFLRNLGTTLSLTGAGIQDPQAPLRYAQAIADQQRQREMSLAQEEQQKFQNELARARFEASVMSQGAREAPIGPMVQGARVVTGPIGRRFEFPTPQIEPEIPVGQEPLTKKERFGQENTLRKEFSSKTKDFRTVQNSFSRVLSVAKEPSAAGDLALIFNYMKILDPGSVVRESEFRNAEQARAWLGRMDEQGRKLPAGIRLGLQKLFDGTRLLPEQRKDFVTQAANLFRGTAANVLPEIENFKAIAERQGLNSSNIVTEPMDFSERLEKVIEVQRSLLKKGQKDGEVQQEGFQITDDELEGFFNIEGAL